MSESAQHLLHQNGFKPAYLELYENGELGRRVELALQYLESCEGCPRICGINRLKNEKSVCKIGRNAMVSSSFAHFGEEDCLRGWKGSGTIFFAMCNLRCVFCQNYDISHYRSGREVTAEELAQLMIQLQKAGCHNINLVTPEHVVPQILEALPIAIQSGLNLPIVYNTSGYDSLESLRLMDGVVDIYMPDFKYWSVESAKKYLKAKDYPEKARIAIREMHRQVGDLKLDENGLALRGLLVRRLVMPNSTEESKNIIEFIASEISKDTYINVMDQYHPDAKVNSEKYAEINRRITSVEYQQAIQIANKYGIRRIDNRKSTVFNVM
jgi:putative pyruvate formate lyase activating enzyme